MTEKEYEGFVTFGSKHLKGFNVAPMSVMLITNGKNFVDARNKLVENKDLGISNMFASQYDISNAPKMSERYGMRLYTIEELLKKKI